MVFAVCADRGLRGMSLDATLKETWSAVRETVVEFLI